MIFSHQINPDLSLALPQLSMDKELFEITDKNREYLAPWLPWVKTTLQVSDTTKYISNALKEYSEQKNIQLIIMYKGKIAGSIAFISLNMENKNAEIGYWLAQEYTKKGIMTESVKALLNYGFNILGMHRIEICCDPENVASQNIAKRVGMIQDGILRGNAFENGKFCDTIVYSMLKPEWENN